MKYLKYLKSSKDRQCLKSNSFGITASYLSEEDMDFLFQKLLAICEKENPQSDFTSKFQFALDVLLPEVYVKDY